MRTDYDPTTVKRRLTREALSYLAHGALFGLGFIPSRHRPQRARDIHTLVFVHGLGANRGSFFPLQAYLKLKGFDRQLAFSYPSRSGSIEGMAIALKERLKREVLGGRIDLICHSMGGLVARYYLQVLGGHRRVDRLITLATPHHGSHSSVYVPTKLFYQFKPEGRFIDYLNRLAPPVDVECHSFAAGRDLMVLPPESGLAPFGETRIFEELGHLDIMLSPTVFAAVREVLNGAGSSATCDRSAGSTSSSAGRS